MASEEKVATPSQRSSRFRLSNNPKLLELLRKTPPHPTNTPRKLVSSSPPDSVGTTKAESDVVTRELFDASEQDVQPRSMKSIKVTVVLVASLFSQTLCFGFMKSAFRLLCTPDGIYPKEYRVVATHYAVTYMSFWLMCLEFLPDSDEHITRANFFSQNVLRYFGFHFEVSSYAISIATLVQFYLHHGFWMWFTAIQVVVVVPMVRRVVGCVFAFARDMYVHGAMALGVSEKTALASSIMKHARLFADLILSFTQVFQPWHVPFYHVWNTLSVAPRFQTWRGNWVVVMTKLVRQCISSSSKDEVWMVIILLHLLYKVNAVKLIAVDPRPCKWLWNKVDRWLGRRSPERLGDMFRPKPKSATFYVAWQPEWEGLSKSEVQVLAAVKATIAALKLKATLRKRAFEARRVAQMPGEHV